MFAFMTPKEKAKALVNNFYYLTAVFDNSQAKECALITVNELITNCQHGQEEYWQEVKNEIEKL